MRVLTHTLYSGPNPYADFPVVRLGVDLEALEAWPSARLGAAFVDPLLAALPGLADHGCSYGTAGGFVRRLREGEGTWMGHILEHVALELQTLAGSPVSFGKTRSDGRPGVYQVVYEYEREDLALGAGALALRLLLSLVPPALRGQGRVPDGFDFPAARDALVALARAPGATRSARAP